MDNKKTLKIVWLCHFSNQEIQEILKPRQRIGEIAPWITALAKLFEDRNEVELHIVSPHEYISGYKCFEIRGIHYHFFNSHIPFWGRHWPVLFKFDYWTDFLTTKKTVKKIIERIQPDLIHLHGAENAYYSSSILQFKDEYPVLITIQGFISNTRDKSHYQIANRIQCEQQIIKTFKHFGYRTQTMGEDIKKYNPQAELHWHHYPFPDIKAYEVEKKFDIVFFARIAKDKGIEDLLQVLAIIKQNRSDVSLCVIGGAHPTYIGFLKKMADRLAISKNIYWAGFLPKQEEVHKLAASARISVLPTYHDIISGTIIESMFLKLPVVAYDVGSIHEVNSSGSKYVHLVEKGNVNDMAMKIQALLINSQQYLENLGQAGFKRAKFLFNNDSIFDDLKKAYISIKKDFNNISMHYSNQPFENNIY